MLHERVHAGMQPGLHKPVPNNFTCTALQHLQDNTHSWALQANFLKTRDFMTTADEPPDGLPAMCLQSRPVRAISA